MDRQRALVVEEDPVDKFRNPGATRRYKKIFSIERLRVERVVTLSDFEHLGIPQLFRSRGWLSVIAPAKEPHPANIQIVREFYANIPPFSADQRNKTPEFRCFDPYLHPEKLHFSTGRKYPNSFEVYLRGKTLNFSVSSIAQLLNLPMPEFTTVPPDFAQVLGKLDMKLVKSTLAGNNRIKILTDKRLTKFYNVLHRIVCVLIDPPSPPDSEYGIIGNDRARLLYAIGNNVSIHLPTYIFRAICHAAHPSLRPESLPFPSLITLFALANRVRLDTTDNYSIPWMGISYECVFGCSRETSSSEGSPQTSSPEVSPAPASKRIPPQLNRPPVVRPGMAPRTSSVIWGQVPVVSTQSGIIPPSSKQQPSAVNVVPAVTPTLKPSPPQLNQPPVVRHGMALPTKDIANLRGDVHVMSTPSAILPSSKQPSPEIIEIEEENNDKVIPNSSACINPSTSTCDLHPKKKAKQDPLEHAISEQVAHSLENVFASKMKVELSGEEVHGVVSKIPNLGRLQVFKAVRIILRSNPQEFFLLKSLPDVEKTEWILFLINEESQGNFPDKC